MLPTGWPKPTSETAAVKVSGNDVDAARATETTVVNGRSVVSWKAKTSDGLTAGATSRVSFCGYPKRL